MICGDTHELLALNGVQIQALDNIPRDELQKPRFKFYNFAFGGHDVTYPLDVFTAWGGFGGLAKENGFWVVWEGGIDWFKKTGERAGEVGDFEMVEWGQEGEVGGRGGGVGVDRCGT